LRDVKIIVGLGNPGEQYAKTPHNIGFVVADCLGKRFDATFRRGLRFSAHTASARHAGTPLLLVKPRTYMNNSGLAVSKIARYRKVSAADTIVIVDDADLPLGRLRVKARGGTGGHRGLASLIQHLGSDTFARVRVGIGRDERGEDLVDHVLTPFSEEERRVMAPVVERAADAVLYIVEHGVDAAMNIFNGPPEGSR